METQRYYIHKIREDLCARQRANPQYSLRAYARDLGMHSSTLGQVLKGKRALPIKDFQRVASKLELGPKERTLFLESLYKTKTNIDDIQIKPLDDRFMLDESYYQIIAEWEHYVVLDLFEVKDFEATVEQVCARLGVSELRAQQVLENLLISGLLAKDAQGQLRKVHADIRTTEDITNQALKVSHRETLQMGLQKLEEIEVELRDFSSTTVAIDLEKLPEAKTIIREFRQKMAALLRDGHKTDVYQLAIQFYPVTQLDSKELQ